MSVEKQYVIIRFEDAYDSQNEHCPWSSASARLEEVFAKVRVGLGEPWSCSVREAYSHTGTLAVSTRVCDSTRNFIRHRDMCHRLTLAQLTINKLV